VVAQKTRYTKNTLQPSNIKQTTPLVQPITSNADITQILTKMNDMVNMINEIKEDLQKIDKRIQYLEEDAYYYHDGDDWAEEDPKATPTHFKSSQLDTLNWNTPTGQTSQTPEGMFSYQRKRPAFESPEQINIQREQHSLHTRIDELGSHLENITESLTQLTDTQLNSGRSTPQSHSQP
jgi:tetrahydromethanopterin S-methyltransferase subunit G